MIHLNQLVACFGLLVQNNKIELTDNTSIIIFTNYIQTNMGCIFNFSYITYGGRINI